MPSGGASPSRRGRVAEHHILPASPGKALQALDMERLLTGPFQRSASRIRESLQNPLLPDAQAPTSCEDEISAEVARASCSPDNSRGLGQTHQRPAREARVGNSPDKSSYPQCRRWNSGRSSGPNGTVDWMKKAVDKIRVNSVLLRCRAANGPVHQLDDKWKTTVSIQCGYKNDSQAATDDQRPSQSFYPLPGRRHVMVDTAACKYVPPFLRLA